MDGPASTRLQLVHLSSLATGYLLIGALVSGAVWSSSFSDELWSWEPTKSAAPIPDVWALTGGSGPIRLAVLFGATIVVVALLVAHQMKRALASDRRALVALEAAIIERRNEAP